MARTSSLRTPEPFCQTGDAAGAYNTHMIDFARMIVCVLLPAAIAAGGSPSTPPQDAHPTDATTWMQRIDERLDQIDSLEAIVRYDTIQGLVGDSQTRYANLRFDGEKPRRFAVRFYGIIYGQPPMKPIDEQLIFDGRYLAEVKPADQTFTRWELVREGEQADDLFDMTDSRFPLPMDMDPQKIDQRFDAVLIDPVQPDPVQGKAVDNAVQIRLTPKPGLEAGYRQMDLWFDRDTRLPVLVHALDAGESGDELLIRMSNVQTDVPLDETIFNTRPPTQGQWQVQLVPLERQVEVESETQVLPGNSEPAGE